MRGGSVEQSLASSGPWPIERVTRLVEQIGGARGVAHRAGVVHRDVKPANVLLDENGNAHLCDFGIALRQDASYVGGEYSAGSPRYASPEQFARTPVTARSDLYSFAAMVWELLTGVPPFVGENASAVARAKLERPVPSLAAYRPELASALDSVLQRATAVRADDRQTSVDEFVLAWRAVVIGARAEGDATTGAEATSAHSNPYKGLRSFGEADAREFFGRAALVDGLVDAIDRTRVLLVVGPSGSGKSSLVHAGLTPRLRERRARVVALVPTDNPCEQLRTALLNIAQRPFGTDVVDAVTQVATETDGRLVIVVDQFEELWTLTDDVAERARFIELLTWFAADEATDVRVVLAIRADFCDRPLAEPTLGPLVADSVFAVTPMTAAELSEAVRAPANAVGVSFEPGLDAEIVADVVSQPAALPLLQFALAELFERRVGTRIPRRAYHELGGLAAAVAAGAEGVFATLGEQGQRAARGLFSRLVTPGAGVDDTRRRAPRGEFSDVANGIADRFAAQRLLVIDCDAATREPTIEIAHEALLRRWPRLRGWLDEDRERLHVMQQLARGAGEWDAAGRRQSDLFRGPRLALAGEIHDSAGLALAPLEEEFLIASRDAEEAERQAEQAMLSNQARQNRRLRRALIGATVALIAALLATSIAFVQRGRADDQTKKAEAALARADQNATQAEAARARADFDRLIAQSTADVLADPVVSSTRAALLAVEAYKRAITPGDKWRAAGAVQTVLAQQSKGVLSSIATGDLVTDVNVGAKVVAAGTGSRVGIWDVASRQTLYLIETAEGTSEAPDRNVKSVALSADEEYVAGSTLEGVNVYSVRTGQRVALLHPGSAPKAMAFDPLDSGRLAVGTFEGNVSIVRWASGQVELRVAAPGAVIRGRFTADGRRLVATSDDGSVRVWDARSGQLLVGPLEAGRGDDLGRIVGRPAISPNAQLLATFSLNGLVAVWNLATGALVRKFDYPSGPTTVGVEFVDDATLITDAAGSVRRVDIASGRELSQVPDGGGRSIAVNPTRSTVAVGSGDSIYFGALDLRQIGARLGLPLAPGFDRIIPGIVTALSANHDGTRLLAMTSQAYVIDTTSPTPEWKPVSFAADGLLTRASFTDDGRVITTVHSDVAGGTAAFRQWDPVTLRQIGPVVRFPTLVDALTLSRDKRYVAVADRVSTSTADRVQESNATTLRVFDTESGAQLRLLDLGVGAAGAYRNVFSLSFSRDASRLAAGVVNGTEGLVWTWNEPGSVTVPLPRTQDVGFDAAGKYLIGVGGSALTVYDAVDLSPIGEPVVGNRFGGPTLSPRDSVLITQGSCAPFDEALPFHDVVLWDVENRIEIGIGLRLNCGGWLPDGSGFFGKDSNSIQIWDIDPATWVEAACRLAGRNLTEQEWERYGPQAPYAKTCP
jgi:WD40 repeat protein